MRTYDWRCLELAIVPKRKTSKARRDKRRSNVWKIAAPTLVKCARCGEYTRPHRLCKACGYYGDRQVVKVEDYLSDETKAAGFPASDVLRFIFEDGCWVAVRLSGTEPKCKFYYCVCAPDKASAEEKYKALKTAFEPKI